MLPQTLNHSFVNDFFTHFDLLFNDISPNNNSFPKYNIVKKSDSELGIEIALAGYSKKDISVEVKNNILTVTGNKVKEDKKYLHQGIAYRTFSKQWTLPKHMEVSTAKVENGMLYISCKLEIPEEEKPKFIKIS